MSQDGTGMYIRQIERGLQIQNKDQKDLSKLQNQNVQMITVPQGMTVLQNPLNISQVPSMLGQPNSQVYMIPTNQNLVQGGIPQGLIGQQMLPGQNVTVMQPNQLGVPGGVQYNVPLMQMNMQHNSQYMPGLNLNSQLSAQQLNAALAGHQLQLPNQHLGTIPIVQQPSSQLTNPQTQQPVHQLLPQNFITPTSQYGTMPQQYLMPTNSGGITNNPNVQYTLPTPVATSNNGNGNGNSSEGENSNGNGQANYITSSSQEQAGGQYTIPASVPQQTFPTDGSTTQATLIQPNPPVTPSYGSNGGTATPTNLPYSNQTASQPPSYPTNGSTQSGSNYSAPASSQSTPQTFSPSTTLAPNQNYPAPAIPTMPMAYPPNQNPYPNATGQNLAAYANNQYQYNSRPWFRPRYGSPQGSPYSAGAGPPPSGPPMTVPPPTGNYNYWQDS